jgi:hypothetical protein
MVRLVRYIHSQVATALRGRLSESVVAL